MPNYEQDLITALEVAAAVAAAVGLSWAIVHYAPSVFPARAVGNQPLNETLGWLGDRHFN